MREFKYVAINKRGKSSSGQVAAKNVKDAKAQLLQEGLTPLKLNSLGKSEIGKSNSSKERIPHQLRKLK